MTAMGVALVVMILVILSGLIAGLRSTVPGAFAVSRLFIDLAPVRDSRHIDGSGHVVNNINYPVIAKTNPPFLVAALEFFAARRPRSQRQMFETPHHADNHFRWQPMQLFFRACG